MVYYVHLNVFFFLIWNTHHSPYNFYKGGIKWEFAFVSLDHKLKFRNVDRGVQKMSSSSSNSFLKRFLAIAAIRSAVWHHFSTTCNSAKYIDPMTLENYWRPLSPGYPLVRLTFRSLRNVLLLSKFSGNRCTLLNDESWFLVPLISRHIDKRCCPPKNLSSANWFF